MGLDALKSIASATALEQLTQGQVSELQSALNSLGYTLAVDGMLGPMTKAMWARFKSDNALGSPDEIGPGSVAVLQSRLASGAGADNVPPQAVNLVKDFEGYRSTAYQDGVGVWTIGYGTTVYPSGNHVASGETVTVPQALQYLAHDMEGTAETLARTVPYWGSMNSNQRSALISFGYNLGSGFYGSDGFHSITAALHDHRWSDVPNVMTLYSDPNDLNVHAGLLRRRIAEGDLWQGKGQYASVS